MCCSFQIKRLFCLLSSVFDLASVVFGNNIEMLLTAAFHISVLSDDISLLEIILVPIKAVAPDRKVMARPPL